MKTVNLNLVVGKRLRSSTKKAIKEWLKAYDSDDPDPVDLCHNAADLFRDILEGV